MLRLVTGLPGDGKTSNELWHFLNAPEYAGRPKYCTPVKGFEPHKHGVTAIEHISCWQDLPDTSVIFCDEVQDYCGLDIDQRKPPEWVQQLARHRHRGFDFIFTTQSPGFLHPFPRKLAKPHVHYIRPWNMKMFQYTWDAVQSDPLSKSAKSLGTRRAMTPNPEVFKLYTSTVLDTHKKRPPYKIIGVAIGAALVVVVGVYLGYSRLHAMGQRQVVPEAITTTTAANAATGQKPDTMIPSLAQQPDMGASQVWSAEGIKPRLAGQAYSAPIYDGLSAPTDFPRVSACLQSKARESCDCYSQQGTPLDVPKSACAVFVRYGSFDPWLSGRKASQQRIDHEQVPEPVQQLAAQPVSKPRATGAVVNIVEQPKREDLAKR